MKVRCALCGCCGPHHPLTLEGGTVLVHRGCVLFWRTVPSPARRAQTQELTAKTQELPPETQELGSPGVP